MTESDIRRLMVELAEIKGDVRAIRDENAAGKEQHVDFEARLRALERVRWAIAGAFTVLGSGVGAVLTRILGG